jgi:glycosyltransferase involved in cell wall biosynthesis
MGDVHRTSDKGVLHIVGLPHTIVNQEFSHCAFTGKILRFAKMMAVHGWYVVEYSNGASESAATEKISILSAELLKKLSMRRSEQEDYLADINNPVLVSTFNQLVVQALQARAVKGDIVCHVFGPSAVLVKAAPTCFHVESGIGYTCTNGALPYRVFETSAWMHWHLGRRTYEWGKNYEFVASNYYDLADWPVVSETTVSKQDQYVLYFGRITRSKGMETIVAIAQRMPLTKFVLVGQGDPTPWTSQSPNIEARPPVQGAARAPLLGNASVVIAPTSFIEPFCGAAVEAQLCGTPVVSSAFGAFWETIEDGVSGYRCNSLADFIGAIRRAPNLDRRRIAERARRLYSLETVGLVYDTIFKNIIDQGGKGWYSATSHKFGTVEIVESVQI